MRQVEITDVHLDPGVDPGGDHEPGGEYWSTCACSRWQRAVDWRFPAQGPCWVGSASPRGIASSVFGSHHSCMRESGRSQISPLPPSSRGTLCGSALWCSNFLAAGGTFWCLSLLAAGGAFWRSNLLAWASPLALKPSGGGGSLLAIEPPCVGEPSGARTSWGIVDCGFVPG